MTNLGEAAFKGSTSLPTFVFFEKTILLKRMNTSQCNWYIAYTFPHFEKKIYTDLKKRKVEAYLPLQKVTHRWSDRFKNLMVPLFPNYIFIKVKNLKSFNLFEIKGILRLVSFEGQPAVISEDEILVIRKLENQIVGVDPSLIEGASVRIVHGPLAGLDGKLINRKGADRFAVRIETLRQSLILDIPPSHLKKV